MEPLPLGIIRGGAPRVWQMKCLLLGIGRRKCIAGGIFARCQPSFEFLDKRLEADLAFKVALKDNSAPFQPR